MACKGNINSANLVDQVEQLSTDMNLMHTVTQGDEKATAILGGKETPSVRKMVADITKAGDGAVSLATQQAERAEACADKSCECARQAALSTEQAANIAESLPGFINGAHAFFGLRMEGTCLMVDKYEDGEEIDTTRYGYTTMLPAEAQFFLEDGCLKVRLPFTI